MFTFLLNCLLVVLENLFDSLVMDENRPCLNKKSSKRDLKQILFGDFEK